MDRPPFTTVLSAAVASAAAFFVITRSGIAGTLAGAAVASMVYTGASHGVRHALERSVGGVRRRFVPEAEVPVDEAPMAISAERDGRASADASLLPLPGRHRPARSVTATWGPVLLAAAALLTSVYSMTSGTPIERVVVRERIVERPVVTERVVVQTQTVTTVPQSVPVHGTQQAAGTPTTTTTMVAAGPAVTTATTATTTTSTAPPTTVTTSTVAPVSTTAPTAPAP